MDVSHLLEREDVVARKKGDWKWHHLFVPVFFFLLGFILPDVKKLFYANYWTTIGSTIYVPEDSWKEFLTHPQRFEAVIRHEVQHVLDSRRERILYGIKYLTSRRWRSYYERRGYSQNLIVAYEQHGVITDALLEWVVRHFTDSYVYDPIHGAMDPDARDKFERIRDGIVEGKYRGLDPDIR